MAILCSLTIFWVLKRAARLQALHGGARLASATLRSQIWQRHQDFLGGISWESGGNMVGYSYNIL